MGAMFYGHILSTAWKKGMVLSNELTLLAFSEEMPSSFQMISPNVWGNASGSASVSESIVISRIDTVK